MNFSDLSESDFNRREESSKDVRKMNPKPDFTPSSWSRSKDPRIVRVSGAFGGKDRHSKVSTVKGLRDRRVRLSVPTAIQLYDLQERLGLNQPSKVVDWLLAAAKHDIDQLPPLPMQLPPPPPPPIQAMLSSNTPNWGDCWNLDRSKEIARETDEIEEGNIVANGSFFKMWDPSDLCLSRFKSYDDNFDTRMVPSGNQLPVCFLPHDRNSGEFDRKQPDFQTLGSSSSSNFVPPLYTINQGMRVFDLSMNSKLFTSDDNGGNKACTEN